MNIYAPIPFDFPPLPVGPEEVPTLLRNLRGKLDLNKIRFWKRIGFVDLEEYFP